jgi:hypothetical protein
MQDGKIVSIDQRHAVAGTVAEGTGNTATASGDSRPRSTPHPNAVIAVAA